MYCVLLSTGFLFKGDIKKKRPEKNINMFICRFTTVFWWILCNHSTVLLRNRAPPCTAKLVRFSSVKSMKRQACDIFDAFLSGIPHLLSWFCCVQVRVWIPVARRRAVRQLHVRLQGCRLQRCGAPAAITTSPTTHLCSGAGRLPLPVWWARHCASGVQHLLPDEGGPLQRAGDPECIPFSLLPCFSLAAAYSLGSTMMKSRFKSAL